jgi:hypothetical protein
MGESIGAARRLNLPDIGATSQRGMRPRHLMSLY